MEQAGLERGGGGGGGGNVPFLGYDEQGSLTV